MQKNFERLATDKHSKARRGRLTTAHGEIDTPAFMPVGTQGSVKGVSPRELRVLHAQIVLGNTYHLFVRPGLDVIKHFGSLHNFMNWDGPILTDSGGYQIFSLAKLRKITEEGVEFQNHIDGARAFISPEIAMEIQTLLGSDIAMALDECVPYPCEYDYAAQSAEMTTRWAKRCREWKRPNRETAKRGLADSPTGRFADSMLFGIVQGAIFEHVRKASAQAIVDLDFDGYAIGGVSVGEPEEEMMRMGGAVLAREQATLRDGTWHAAATAGVGRARDGHVRLRVADAPGAKWNSIHRVGHDQFKKRRVHSGQESDRRKLRVRCVS